MNKESLLNIKYKQRKQQLEMGSDKIKTKEDNKEEPIASTWSRPHLT